MKMTALNSMNVSKIIVLVCFLCVLFGSSPAQEFKTVHPGIEYALVTHKLGIDPVRINLLRLDLTKVRLDVHHALDRAIGVETTSSIATRHRAVAAINAGFFRLDKSAFAGDSVGVFVVDGEVYSESHNNRIALSIFNLARRTEIKFDHLESQIELALSTGHTIKLLGVNRELRARADSVLFTPRFGSAVPAQDSQLLIVVRKGKISEIRKAVEVNNIPRDGFLILANEETEPSFSSLKVGERVKLRFSPPYAYEWYKRGQLFKSEDIVAGVPQLIKNGRIQITWEQEKASKSFVETRHPRTAVAKLNDGKFLMLTVDGRQPGVSVGMNLYELADYLLSLGAIDAMNLDGGGSTTMFLDGRVINTPSDKEGERKVSDAIVVTLR